MATERLGEQFEARWRRAYEVRHLENQNRHKLGADDAKAAQQECTSSGTVAGQQQQQHKAAVQGDGAVVSVQARATAAAPPGSPGAHSLPSTAALPSKQPAIRQAEVEDEDDDEEAPAADAAVPARGSYSAAPAGAAAVDADASDAEPECRVVWDSSHSQHSCPASADGAASGVAATGSSNSNGAGCCPEAQALKQQGTELLRQGDLEGALRCYAGAVEAARAARESDPSTLAALHSNCSHVLHKLKRNQEAVAEAQDAHKLSPTWPKPLYRLAQAQLALGQFGSAAASCLKGEQLSKKDSEGHTEFTPLLDRLAVTAAKAGSLAGYTGILLEVRDAGEDAWLCQPAPYVPELDGPEDEDSLLPASTLPALTAGPSSNGPSSGDVAGVLAALSLSGAAGGDALANWDYRQTAAVRERRRTSFRSLKEAVAAARDGDRIVLRRGTHNGLGEAINLSKRVLIEGEGGLGEVVIDQRANSPTFRISRGGVTIRNVTLDQSGFCEAFMVAGGPGVAPLIEDMVIKCSGDDAINVCGQADPTFRQCTIASKKCGARVYDSAGGRFERCAFEGCGEQGVKAMESSAPVLSNCTLVMCGEEGLVATDSARPALLDCDILGCKGPGVDVTGQAQVTAHGGTVEGNVGGVWVWDSARAVLQGVTVAGGPSHAILADGLARLDVKECQIQGLIHATDAAWEGVLDGSNSLLDPEQPADFPPEEGPFKFVPNRFSAKQ